MFREFDIHVPGVPVALSPKQAVAYLGEQKLPPRAIHKALRGQMTYGAVRTALARARKDGRDIPRWTTWGTQRSNNGARLSRGEWFKKPKMKQRS